MTVKSPQSNTIESIVLQYAVQEASRPKFYPQLEGLSPMITFWQGKKNQKRSAHCAVKNYITDCKFDVPVQMYRVE